MVLLDFLKLVLWDVLFCWVLFGFSHVFFLLFYKYLGLPNEGFPSVPRRGKARHFVAKGAFPMLLLGLKCFVELF